MEILFSMWYEPIVISFRLRGFVYIKPDIEKVTFFETTMELNDKSWHDIEKWDRICSAL